MSANTLAPASPARQTPAFASRSFEATRHVRLDGAIYETLVNIVTIAGPVPAVTGQMRCYVDGLPVTEAEATALTHDALSDGKWERL